MRDYHHVSGCAVFGSSRGCRVSANPFLVYAAAFRNSRVDGIGGGRDGSGGGELAYFNDAGHFCRYWGYLFGSAWGNGR